MGVPADAGVACGAGAGVFWAVDLESEQAAARHRSGRPAQSAAKSEPARYVGGDLRQERELEQVHILLGFPGFSFADHDYYAASVVSTALGGGMGCR